MQESVKSKILTSVEIDAKLERIAHQIHENYYKESAVFLVGIVGRGYEIAEKLVHRLNEIADFKAHLIEIKLDKDYPLDHPIALSENIDLTDKAVLLVDDVLNSGKTLSYAASFLLNRKPKSLKTVILVNREHHRYPISANFIGLSLATTLHEHIQVELGVSGGVYLL